MTASANQETEDPGPVFSVPPEVVKNYPTWNCEFSDLPPSPTVGATWTMKCQGGVQLKAPLLVQFPDDKMAYGLVVLKTKADSATAGEMGFLVTGYKPGDYSPPYIVLTDGEAAVRIDNLRWKISSVVEAKEGEKPQPFPPYGPFFLRLPWWYYGIWAGLLLVLCLIAFAIWRWRKKIRREREELKKLESALTPYLEVHRDLRRLMRERTTPALTCETLAKTIRVYLSRRWKVLMLKMNPRQILKAVRRHYAPEQLKELQDFLRELDHGLKDSTKVSLEDRDQLITMARGLIDRLESRK